MFSDCSGPCETCANFYIDASCMAGHGDDHYVEIDMEERCPKCDSPVNDDTQNCPNCKYPVRQHKLETQIKILTEANILYESELNLFKSFVAELVLTCYKRTDYMAVYREWLNASN